MKKRNRTLLQSRKVLIKTTPSCCHTQIITDRDAFISNINVRGSSIQKPSKYAKYLRNYRSYRAQSASFKIIQQALASQQSVQRKRQTTPQAKLNLTYQTKPMQANQKYFMHTTYSKFSRSKTMQSVSDVQSFGEFEEKLPENTNQIQLTLEKNINNMKSSPPNKPNKTKTIQQRLKSNFLSIINQFNRKREEIQFKYENQGKGHKEFQSPRKFQPKRNYQELKKQVIDQKRIQETKQFFLSVFYKNIDQTSKIKKYLQAGLQTQKQTILNNQLVQHTQGGKVYIMNWTPWRIKQTKQESQPDQNSNRQSFLKVKSHSFSQTERDKSNKERKCFMNKTFHHYKVKYNSYIDTDGIQPWKTNQQNLPHF